MHDVSFTVVDHSQLTETRSSSVVRMEAGSNGTNISFNDQAELDPESHLQISSRWRADPY